MKLWSKRLSFTTAVLGIIVLLMQTPQAVYSSTAHEPKIVQAVSQLALDDQGNVWLPAMNMISVKDGFYTRPMVKSKSLDKFIHISSSETSPQIGVKEDGSVWKIEFDSLKNQQMKMNVSEHVPSMLEEQQIPHLKNIVKADNTGIGIGVALDADGKVWIFEAVPHWVNDFHPQTTVVSGIDQVVDFVIGSTRITFLKADGTVWYLKILPKTNLVVFNSIQTEKAVQMTELHNIIKIQSDSALGKDGSFWIWGNGKLANGKDGEGNHFAAPFRVKGITDIEDWFSAGDHALFIKKNGTVWQWGSFVKKVVALGERPLREWKEFSPVPGLTDVVSVYITSNLGYLYGGETQYAIKNDGTLWMWGMDQNNYLNLDPNPLQVEFKNYTPPT